MTQEQIIDAGINYTMSTRPVCMGGAAFEDMIRQCNRNPSFEAGATLAKEKIIEKACEWLQNWASLSVNDTTDSLDEEDLVKRFKKAMEEEI